MLGTTLRVALYRLIGLPADEARPWCVSGWRMMPSSPHCAGGSADSYDIMQDGTARTFVIKAINSGMDAWVNDLVKLAKQRSRVYVCHPCASATCQTLLRSCSSSSSVLSETTGSPSGSW